MSYSREKATLNAKAVADFVRQHPEGVTAEHIRKAGLPVSPIYTLVKLKHVHASQVREPERGPRAYHWLWTPTTSGSKAPITEATK